MSPLRSMNRQAGRVTAHCSSLRMSAVVALAVFVALPAIVVADEAGAASRRDSCKTMGLSGATVLGHKGKIVDADSAIVRAVNKRDITTGVEKAADIADARAAVDRIMPKYATAQAACLAQTDAGSPPKACVGLALFLGSAFQNLDRQAQLFDEIVPLIGQPGTQADIDQRAVELGTLRHDVKKLLRNDYHDLQVRRQALVSFAHGRVVPKDPSAWVEAHIWRRTLASPGSPADPLIRGRGCVPLQCR